MEAACTSAGSFQQNLFGAATFVGEQKLLFSQKFHLDGNFHIGTHEVVQDDGPGGKCGRGRTEVVEGAREVVAAVPLVVVNSWEMVPVS